MAVPPASPLSLPKTALRLKHFRLSSGLASIDWGVPIRGQHESACHLGRSSLASFRSAANAGPQAPPMAGATQALTL
jgi:hypothetical protein